MAFEEKILLADRDGPWRNELSELLLKKRPGCVRTSSSAADLLRALTGPTRPRLVVVGHELDDGDSFDTLYQYASERSKIASPAKNESIICLVTETRLDLELLDLLRKRGVSQFIYRDDLTEISATRLLQIFEQPIRPNAYPLNLSLSVKKEGLTIKGTLTQMRLDGCQASFKALDLQNLSIGDWLDLSFDSAHGAAINCKGEIRAITSKRSWFKTTILLDLTFVAAEFDDRKGIEEMMHSLQRAAEDDVTGAFMLRGGLR